ncbi:hypothetical protein BOO69_05190 [Sulfitobacter alexandrii]|uniref:AAA+ family ATPase n=1 Tax=Sulfitobacter alexandrii TaxID=1917485 RepID=A0A1J0WF01_9RHOB|nr:hypothetical protein [Sulfitobacter alexandrii]APE42883.1 hypothetical protein BOO69_05190 [Sulfitobacter alexandrii]
MRHLAPLALLICLPLAVHAQEDEGERGLSLMERGAQMFMEGIMKEMAPAIDELEGLADDVAPALRSFADEMGPKLAEILEQVKDWSVYEAPEMLPNGDIIIRRKPDAPMEEPAEPTEPAPQIDL